MTIDGNHRLARVCACDVALHASKPAYTRIFIPDQRQSPDRALFYLLSLLMQEPTHAFALLPVVTWVISWHPKRLSEPTINGID